MAITYEYNIAGYQIIFPDELELPKTSVQHIASARLTVSCKLVIVMITYLSYVLNIYMAKASTYHF